MANISRRLLRQIVNEIPSGDIDGINTTYMLLSTPIEGTLVVELNGLVQTLGSGRDYLLSGNQIIFTKAPKIGNTILVQYYR